MIRFIKEDSTFFYVVTERGQTHITAKNRGKLVGYTEKTWSVKRDGYVTTYDENGNYLDRQYVGG